MSSMIRSSKRGLKGWRVLFLGQKKLGEACFKLLVRYFDRAQILGVVTNCTKEVWWKSHWISTHYWGKNLISNACSSEKEIIRCIKGNKVNLLISVQHPWILSEEVLSLVNGMAFNLHNARLPDYRGYNSVNHCILNKEETYTSTIHWMIREVDMGPVAFEKSFKISEKETAKSLYAKARQSGKYVFKKFLDYLLEQKDIPRHPVIGRGRFYKRSSLGPYREVKRLEEIEYVDRIARALYFPPFEPAFYKRNGKKVYLLPEGSVMETVPHKESWL